MIVLLAGIALLLAILSILPSAVFSLECFMAALPPRKAAPAAQHSGPSPRIAVLIPAHIEEGLIGRTVLPLVAQLGPRDRIVVVADNCDDATAAIARTAGAEVVERKDPTHQGKGYALSYGFAHLAADPPDVVIVVDADCRVTPGALQTLASLAVATNRPIQSENLLLPPEHPTPEAMISALAFLVRSSVRARGLMRLGLPCQLGGTGMAIPWQVLLKAPATEAHLAEDMLMGVALAEIGHPPLYCPSAGVESYLPVKREAGKSQHRRWEHGHLEVLIHKVPRVVMRGLARRDVQLVAMGLDLLVPPLTLLVLFLLATLALTITLGLTLHYWVPASIATSSFIMVAFGTSLAWLKFGRHLVPLRYVLTIPAYVLWKLPIYLSFALRRRQKTWERAEREPAPLV